MSLLQMSLSGAAMILVIVLIRVLALHKLSKRFFLALWSLPLLRLLIPFSIPAAFSAYSLLSPQSPSAPMVNAETSPVPAPDILPGAAVVVPVAETASSIDFLTLLWLIGMLGCAAFFAFAYIRCRWKFRESLPVNSSCAQAWLQAHRLRRTVSIRYSDRISTPLTYGIFHPVILLPKSTDWKDRKTQDYVLTHELVHIRRFDALRKLAFVLALCIHWFDPLVWVMYVLVNRDMELSCDEAVLREFGKTARASYALTLIRMEEHKSGLLLGSQFSKNSIEERIQAIMKMKKNSLAALLAAVVLAGGTTAFFATSAKAETTGQNAPQYGCTVENKDSLMSFTHADGMTYYSWDNGETWTAMTDEEFAKAYPNPEVEWWTADEYAAWLEEEKKELQDIIGSRGWTGSTGWFTWTQEMATETIAKYEETLAMIQNGYLVSKSVDGSEDTVLVMNPLDRVLGDGSYEVSDKAPGYDSTFENADRDSLFADYKRCGLTFDSTDGDLYWDGRRVRIFIDGVEHEGGFFSQYEHYDPDGQVDLHTVRERADNEDGSYDPMGPLVKIEEFTPDRMFLDALEAQRYLRTEIQYEAGRTADELERYIPFGLTSKTNANTGELTMSWNGRPVRSLFDPERQLWIANSLGGNGLDLEAVYENGDLTGLRAIENSDREFVETGTVINSETSAANGAGDVSGETIAQRMEKYAPYGVTYEERNGKRTIRCNGQAVGTFIDKGPDGVFSIQSTDTGSVDLQTIYDGKGELIGVELIG